MFLDEKRCAPRLKLALKNTRPNRLTWIWARQAASGADNCQWYWVFMGIKGET